VLDRWEASWKDYKCGNQ